MNYLAHGLRFVDRPWFLAGTAVPDLLSVSDRRVRMRERRVLPVVEASEEIVGPERREIAAGVLQHLTDDDWFHRTPGFHDATGRLTVMFREAVGTDGFRCGFLGHVVCEMLIDGVLAERRPGALDAYYDAFGVVESRVVEEAVNGMAARPATNLARFLDTFTRVRFLHDYADADRLLYRLNQVLQRVKLQPLPPEVVGVLERGRDLVEDRLEDLLPPDHFGPIDAE